MSRVLPKLLSVAVLVLGGACDDAGNSSPAPTGMGGMLNGGGEDTTCAAGSDDSCPGAAAAACESGLAQSCHCPDGALSGSQACLEGVWQPCACATAAEPATATPEPIDADADNFCPELTGVAGCTAEAYVSEELPASILFVLDRSGSMSCNLPPLQTSADCELEASPTDPDAESKWDVTTSALLESLRTLTGRGSSAGLTIFSSDGSCGADSVPSVPMAELENTHVDLMGSVLAATQPKGATPIVGATILAYAHLHEEIMAAGNRFVVLITDGAESCDEDALTRLLDEEVPKAQQANIRTFVIGAPGSEPARAFLSELAFRGGTARADGACAHDLSGAAEEGDCHYDMTNSDDFAAELTAGLAAISSAAIGCEFAVPTSDAGDKVNVQYTSSGGDAVCFVKDDSAPCDAGADGWQFARTADGKEDQTKVVLCGPACEQVAADTAARVDILVGCVSLI